MMDLNMTYQQCHNLNIPESCFFTLSESDLLTSGIKKGISDALIKHGIGILTIPDGDKQGRYLSEVVNLIGKAHAHSHQQGALWHIRSGGEHGQETLARSHSLDEFALHTDCSYEEEIPDFIGLQVVQHDSEGGGSNLFIKVQDLIPYISSESLSILQRKTYRFIVPEEFRKDKEFIDAPIIDDEYNIRYRHDIIDLKYATPSQINAINELEQLTYSPKINKKLSITKNNILLLNNKRFLHARTKIIDTDRHIIRVRFFLTAHARG